MYISKIKEIDSAVNCVRAWSGQQCGKIVSDGGESHVVCMRDGVLRGWRERMESGIESGVIRYVRGRGEGDR